MSSVEIITLNSNTWKDQRGWGINPLEAVGLERTSLGDLHIVSIKPKAIRGNHYHTYTTEWLLICNGAVKFAWRTDEEDITHEELVHGTGPVLLKIPSGIGHAVQNISTEEIYLVSFSESGERSTISCPILCGKN